MKKILIILLMLFAMPVHAVVENCGSVKILKFLTGPRHGSMMFVSSPDCGVNGWICLDPNGEFMTLEESKLMYSFLLSKYMSGKYIQLSVYEDKFAVACAGNYSVVEDVRTP